MKGIIFDLDGTMVDNMLVHHQAWQRKLKALGLDLTMEEVRQQIHGVNEEILLRLFGNRFTAEQRSQFAWEKEAEYRKIFKPTLQLITGLKEYLNHLHQLNIPLGIGSAAPKENVDFVIDNLNIRDYFKAVLHAGDVIKGKPDPEIYIKVAETMNVPVSKCLVFEDSPTGVEAANRAGCPVVVVTTSHKESEFERFTNVIRFIDNFSSPDLLHVAEY